MDVLIAHITEFYFNDLRDNLYRLSWKIYSSQIQIHGSFL